MLIGYWAMKFSSRDYWLLCVLNKSKSSVYPHFHQFEVLKSTTVCNALEFLANSTLDPSGVYLIHFPARTEPLLIYMHVTPLSKLSAIMSKVYPYKACRFDDNPAIVLKKGAPELAPVLLKRYNKCLAASYFTTRWLSSSVVTAFKNSGKLPDLRIITLLVSYLFLRL